MTVGAAALPQISNRRQIVQWSATGRDARPIVSFVGATIHALARRNGRQPTLFAVAGVIAARCRARSSAWQVRSNQPAADQPLWSNPNDPLG